jgi:predicted MFS family arabinose efflux permease
VSGLQGSAPQGDVADGIGPSAVVHSGGSAADERFPPTGAEAAPNVYNWYVLVVFTIIFLLASVDRSLVSVVMEPIRLEFHLSDAQLGFLAGLAFGIPYALASLPFGILIDRINRRWLLAGMLALWSFLTGLCGLAQSYVQLLGLRMLVGVAEAGFPAAQSMIADYFSARRRPMALGVFMSGGSLAFVLSFALGGWVADAYGWRTVFFAAGPPGLIVALLFFLTVREPERGRMDGVVRQPDTHAPSFWQAVRFLMASPAFRHLFIGYALVAATTSSFWSWIGSLLIRIHGLEVREAGLYIAFGAGVFGFVGALLGAVVTARLARNGLRSVLTFIAAMSVLLSPFGIAMALATSFKAVIACMVVTSILKSCYTGPAQGIILSLAKTRMRGVAASLVNVAGTLLGFGVGPLLAGSISYLLGGGNSIRYGLAALFLMNLWAGLHFWLARRTVEAEVNAATAGA